MQSEASTRRRSEASTRSFTRFLTFLSSPSSPDVADAHVATNVAPAWDLDAYALMFLADVRSRSFLFAVGIFALQMAMLLLTLVDQLKARTPSNVLQIPINNPTEVVVAQFLSLVVLVLLQESRIFELTVLVAFPPAEVSVTDYPGATRGKWLLGHVCRLAVHLASLLVSFLVIVQEPTVIDIFKDFAAVQFVTKLSQLGFSCAQHGFFGTAIKLDARYAAAWRRADDEAPVERLHALAAAQLAGGRFAAALATHEKALASAPEDQKGACRRKLDAARARQEAAARSRGRKDRLGLGSALVVLAGMVAGWASLVYRQESRGLHAAEACARVDVRLGEMYDLTKRSTSPFAGLRQGPDTVRILLDLASPPELEYAFFNGLYSASWNEIIGDRPVYYENDKRATAGKFHYCAAEKAWVFKLGGFNDGVKRGACGQWLLRSRPTEEFLLEEVGSDWTAWVGASRPVSATMRCMDCRKSSGSGCNFNGECGADRGTCACRTFVDTDETWFGAACQAPPPCEPVDVFAYGDTARDYRQVAHFMPLKDVNKERVLAYQRPVYWKKRNVNATDQNFLLYTGRRWYQTDWPLTKLCPGEVTSCSDNVPCMMDCFARFFQVDFHAYWSNTKLTSTKYVSEETESFTPVGLRWLSLELENRAQGDFGPFGYTFDEGVSSHCFNVSDYRKTVLCGYNGDRSIDTRYDGHEQLNRQRCQCKNGSSGYFCQFGPNHPYVANRIDSDYPCNEFFCDYLKDQEQVVGLCTEECAQIRKSKTCWNAKVQCLSDPGNPSINEVA